MRTPVGRLAICALSSALVCGCARGSDQSDQHEVEGAVAALSNGNLLANPSVETPDPADATKPQFWSKRGAITGTGATGTFAYDTSTANTGSRSVRVDVANRTGGDIEWAPAEVPITAGATYIYRDYYKSNVVSSITVAHRLAGQPGQVFTTIAGSVPVSANWTSVAFSWVAPPNVTTATVFHKLTANGSLWVDDASFSVPQTPDLSSGVPNGDMEQTADLDLTKPLSWTQAGFGTNQATYVYEQTGHSGTHSVSVAVSGYTDGDAKWAFAAQPVTPGTRYLYSDFYRSTAPTLVTPQFTLSDGTKQSLTVNTLAASPGGYAQGYGAFLAPANATSVSVFHRLAQNGFLQIDDAALSALPPPAIVNGVPNGDLEQADYSGATVPTAWHTNRFGTNTTAFTYVADPNTGNHSARIDISAYTDGAASWNFDPVPVQAGKAYRLTASYRSDIDMNWIATVTLTDGSIINLQLPAAFASPSDWASYSAKVYLPDNAVDITLYDKITKVGWVEIDDVGCALAPTAPFTRGLVSLTFDDAYLSDAQYVLPVLEQHDAVATHYVLTGSLGDTDRMTLGDLAALAAHGDQIAGHTVSHADLTTLSPTDLATELLSSKQFLESNGYDPLLDFASPYGAYNEGVLAAVEAAYRSHRTVDAGYNSKDDWDIYRLKVQNMRSTTTQAEVDGWAARAAADKSWLIIVYHDVVTDLSAGTVYSTTPGALAAHLTSFENHGLTIVTVQQGLDELLPQMVCDDANVCTSDVLGQDGYCDFTNNSSSCDDADACTVSDECSAGECISGSARDCGLYACNPASGCRTTCVTGTECSAAAFCKPSSCASSCDDGNACTDDTADADRTCSSTPKSDGTTCGAQAECRSGFCRTTCGTVADCGGAQICSSGLCAANCDDNNPCTTDTVDVTGSICSHTPGNAGAVCRDAVDVCDAAETCTGTSPTCPPDQFQPATFTCRAASNACDSAEKCSSTNATCPADGALNCGLYACDPSTGCKTSCVTGADCGAASYCKAGSCASACDDGNACTTDTADANRTCSSVVKTDGSACGTGLQCSSGYCRKSCGTAADCSAGQVCAAGLCAANCNDNNPCTADTVSADGLTCSHSAAPNGTVCTGANKCQPAACGGGSCIAAPPVVCGALDQCHVAGVCNTATGTCSNPNAANGKTCNDGSLCTTADACNTGVCSGSAVTCNDSNVCTADSCSPAVGCVYTPGNAGTVCRAAAGVCDAAETCTGSAAACPANQLQPATFTCRAASSVCDSPELCTGASTSCPSTSDKLGPTLLPGTDQTVLGNCSFLAGNVSYVFPTELNSASGQCDAPASVKCTTIAANSFGPHTVSCTAKDSSNNVSNTVTFTVTVLEPLSVSLQSSLAAPPSNNVARVGWTVLHSVKLLNCSSSDVTATVAAGVKLTTSLQNGLALGTKRLSASTATPDANGAFVRVGSGAATTFQYKLGTTGMQTTGSGGLLDTRYWLSTMTASYTAAPTITAGSTTARLAITP